MPVSENGLAFCAQREALVQTAYPDSRHLAIGFGINIPGLEPGTTVTIGQAIADYVAAAKGYDADIARVYAGIFLTQQIHDALFSLTWNIGGTQLRKETELRDRIAAHLADPKDTVKRDNACRFILDVRRENDIYFNLSRRCREVVLFQTGDYGDLRKLKIWREGMHPRGPNAVLPDTMDMPKFLEAA